MSLSLQLISYAFLSSGGAWWQNCLSGVDQTLDVAGPAQRLQQFVPAMRSKGRLAAKMDADLTIFDPATVMDRATLLQPEQPSAGIIHVIVNGEFVIMDSAFCAGVLPGRAIRGISRIARETGARAKRRRRTTALFASLLEGQAAGFLQGFDC